MATVYAADRMQQSKEAAEKKITWMKKAAITGICFGAVSGSIVAYFFQKPLLKSVLIGAAICGTIATVVVSKKKQ
jgi:hypothetical protein